MSESYNEVKLCVEYGKRVMNYLKGLLGYTPKANTGSIIPQPMPAFDEDVGGDTGMQIAQGDYQESVLSMPKTYSYEHTVGGDMAMRIAKGEAGQATKRRKKRTGAKKKKQQKGKSRK